MYNDITEDFEENDYLEEDDSVYEGYDEEDGVDEIKGITDKVTDYTFVDLNYPCIVFKNGLKMEKHKVQVISNMVKSISVGMEKDITLYFVNSDNQLFKLGMISGVQVSSLIDISGRENLIAFLDENTELTESLIYTLCTF